MAALPEEAANDLLRRLVEQRRLSSAPQLHVFRHSVTALALPASTTSAHLAHLASFAALADLSLQGCTRLRDAHLAHLAPLAPSLQRLDLAGCTGLSGAGLPHLAALTGLRALSLARCTGLRDDGAAAALADACGGMRQLSSLDVSGLPAVDDATCCRLAAALPHLDTLLLASTAVGDEAMGCLERLRALRRLDVSFTQVRVGRHGCDRLDGAHAWGLSIAPALLPAHSPTRAAAAGARPAGVPHPAAAQHDAVRAGGRGGLAPGGRLAGAQVRRGMLAGRGQAPRCWEPLRHSQHSSHMPACLHPLHLHCAGPPCQRCRSCSWRVPVQPAPCPAAVASLRSSCLARRAACSGSACTAPPSAVAWACCQSAQR